MNSPSSLPIVQLVEKSLVTFLCQCFAETRKVMFLRVAVDCLRPSSDSGSCMERLEVVLLNNVDALGYSPLRTGETKVY